ncbi:hypothetical protein NG99_04510 [Erwinia typographi]|uniref:Uncharacterized protein n=1 Tax=Erwinia typographi TaxID=371042 RepID=A0A0A3Z866_9GAMM|nr:hypothetical protein [Erwinia typographi]KGT95287.1 hypothetical protein NG99_04510 [Erwinia typographi]
MNFSAICQTMTDDACEIISALSQSPTLPLHSIVFVTGLDCHVARFILEQMTVSGMAEERNGQWRLSEAFMASRYHAMA